MKMENSMINLDIKLSQDDISVLSMIDFCEQDYKDYGSYSLAIECKSSDILENYMDGISDGAIELQEELETFTRNMNKLLSKIKKVEE
tara:strand:+ start:1280 stop:1543 length:264 start_codon:yes stop_codon:yes gene_type:complete